VEDGEKIPQELLDKYEDVYLNSPAAQATLVPIEDLELPVAAPMPFAAAPGITTFASADGKTVDVVFLIDVTKSMDQNWFTQLTRAFMVSADRLMSDPDMDVRTCIVYFSGTGSQMCKVFTPAARPNNPWITTNAELNEAVMYFVFNPVFSVYSDAYPVQAANTVLGLLGSEYSSAQFKHVFMLTDKIINPAADDYLTMIDSYGMNKVMLSAVVPPTIIDTYKEVKRTGGTVIGLDAFSLAPPAFDPVIIDHVKNSTIPAPQEAWITLKSFGRVKLDKYPDASDEETDTNKDGTPDSKHLKFPPERVYLTAYLVHYWPWVTSTGITVDLPVDIAVFDYYSNPEAAPPEALTPILFVPINIPANNIVYDLHLKLSVLGYEFDKSMFVLDEILDPENVKSGDSSAAIKDYIDLVVAPKVDRDPVTGKFPLIIIDYGKAAEIPGVDLFAPGMYQNGQPSAAMDYKPTGYGGMSYVCCMDQIEVFLRPLFMR
jgi:hypothetical protein